MFFSSLSKKIVFTVIFSAFSLQADISEVTAVSPSTWHTVKENIVLAREFLLDVYSPSSFMGSNPLSPDVDVEVRGILKSINFSGADTIRLRQLSGVGMGVFGDKNALAFGLIGLPKYIFVAEEWFKTLSYDQKSFLIAHEVAHITQHHGELKIGVTFLLNGFYKNCLAHQEPESIKRFSPLLQLLSVAYPLLLISRITETLADDSALRATNALDGGVSLMNAWKENGIKNDSELPQWKILKWIRKITYRYFTTHPTFEDRIDYLQKLDRKLSVEKLV